MKSGALISEDTQPADQGLMLLTPVSLESKLKTTDQANICCEVKDLTASFEFEASNLHAVRIIHASWPSMHLEISWACSRIQSPAG